MDKNKIIKYQIFSIFFVFILGTILHFTYEWSGENKIVALFSSVNESTWEHLKLLFFPMLISIIIGYPIIGRYEKNFICAKTIGIITAMLFTIVFFYTYTGIIGKNIPIIDISSFFIATIIGEYVSYRLINGMFPCNNVIAIITLILITFLFMIFTFNTPNIALFKDPITGKFGI